MLIRARGRHDGAYLAVAQALLAQTLANATIIGRAWPVKLLSLLDSEHVGERDATALAIERLRRERG